MNAGNKAKRLIFTRAFAAAIIVIALLTMSGCQITLFGSDSAVAKSVQDKFASSSELSIEGMPTADTETAGAIDEITDGEKTDRDELEPVETAADSPASEGTPIPDTQEVVSEDFFIPAEQAVPSTSEEDDILPDVEPVVTTQTQQTEQTEPSAAPQPEAAPPAQQPAQYAPVGIAIARELDFDYAVLTQINNLRASYGRSAASWDDTLAAQCQQHALYLAEGNKFVHSIKIGWEYEVVIAYNEVLDKSHALQVATEVCAASKKLLSSGCTRIAVGAASGLAGDPSQTYIVVQGV